MMTSASQHSGQTEAIRGAIAGRLRPPRGAFKQTVRLRSEAEFNALPPDWAMPWRGFWFVLIDKHWRAETRRGRATFRVL